MQVIKNIYQVGGSLNGLTWYGKYGSYEDCNTYLVKTDEGLIMFDCGSGDSFSQILLNMKDWDLELKNIKACFITHSHFDHAGACYKLNELNIPIYAHEVASESIEAADERCCGYLYHKKFNKAFTDYKLKDGDKVEICGLNIEVNHFPGHTMGCVAYSFTSNEKKIVVSGDIIGTLLDGYHGWDGSFDFDKKVYLQSLRKFSKFDFDIMLPGHGMVYYGSPRVRIEDAFNLGLIEWR